MRHTYEDVIREMKSRGHYHDAEEYQNALRRDYHSEHDTVDRLNPADGAQHTHTGRMAEEAFENLEWRARREEERREEERRKHEHYEHQCRERQRQSEEEEYQQQQQQQQQEQPQPECEGMTP
jgi:ribosomal protein S21